MAGFLNGTDPGLRQTRTPTRQILTDGGGFTANSSTTITLTNDPGTEEHVVISFDGIVQHHSTYTVSGTTVTFNAVIPSGVAEIEASFVVTVSSITVPDGSVSTSKIVDANVTTSKILDANITTDKIADNAISLSKMASGTSGNIISYASGNPVAISTGSANQVLTSAGAGQPPTFADAAAGGAWNLIGSAVASNGDTSLIVTGIDTTYALFAIGVSDLVVSGGQNINLRVGTSGGIISSGNDYRFHTQNSEDGDLSYGAIRGEAFNYIYVSASQPNPAALVYMDVFAKGARIWGNWSSSATGSLNGGQHFSSYVQSADLTIDRVNITLTQGAAFTAGRVSVWGIANA